MLVYMTHPNHGTHIAYSQSEVDTCKANGWKVREPPRLPNVVDTSDGPQQPEGPAVDAIPRKRGRPRKNP